MLNLQMKEVSKLENIIVIQMGTITFKNGHIINLEDKLQKEELVAKFSKSCSILPLIDSFSSQKASACFGKKRLADPNEFLISLGEELWDNGRACGSMFEVTCIFEPGNQCVAQEGGSLTARARVVDRCRDCRGNVAMLLSLEAFASIANIDAVSKVWVSYAKVDQP
ncbi:hypothetical protein KSP39_PZI021489 [Platanthera zijinensis]|uniref:Uncharacterized protein n=1 Tax=Platanthera zijinensis TaxID=2320716 RepID=A0AAP0AXQ7_9ASPA